MPAELAGPVMSIPMKCANHQAELGTLSFRSDGTPAEGLAKCAADVIRTTNILANNIDQAIRD